MSEKGRIVNTGAGGFLNPPGHPEHKYSIETDLRQRPENRGSMSLSGAVDCEWLDAATRAAAKAKLDSWVPLPLDAPEVQDWIRQVIGYFWGCYRNTTLHEPECWFVDKLYILKSGDAARPNEEHAGVHLIRKYYPEYSPVAVHFSEAYWGKKRV